MGVFPRALESQSGARRYITAFRAPFQESRLNPQQAHMLRACSLLMIPPLPPGGEPLHGGFPDDLSQVNLLAWAELVQDVVAGLLALPQGMHNCLFPEVITLLLHLETITQVAFCRHCYLPRLRCRCLRAALQMGAPSTTTTSMASAPTWSQVTELVPGYGSTASMGTTTTLSTSAQGATGVAPPPGLPTPGVESIWNPPQLDFLALPQLPVPPQHQPLTGRGAMLDVRLKSIWDRNPQGLQTIQSTISPLGSQSATLYQQQVLAPVWASGPQLRFAHPTKPTPQEDRDTQKQGRTATRPPTRGQDKSRAKSGNRSRGASTRRPPHQPQGCSRGVPHGPQASQLGNPEQHTARATSHRNRLENLTAQKWWLEEGPQLLYGGLLQVQSPQSARGEVGPAEVKVPSTCFNIRRSGRPSRNQTLLTSCHTWRTTSVNSPA